jgi:hypothetical protein
MVLTRAVFHRHSILFGAFGFCFLNLLLFGDILMKGSSVVLSSSQADLFLHFVAWRQFAFEQLGQGHLALWNPHYLCGAPFLGNFESGLLYPPNWFYLILPLGLAINVGIILHVFFAGFFTYLWASYRGLHPLSSFVSGTVFMFGGAYFLHLYAGHLPNLCTMVWAPLLFLSIDGLIQKVSIRWILLGIFAVAMQILAGHPQYVYFTAIISVFYVLLNLKGNKVKFEILTSFFTLYAGASLITAAQLWTGLEAISECSRNIPLEYHSASSFSFPPENLLTLVLPEFFGNLTTVHYWGRWFLWEVSIFIGITAFFLAFLAIFSSDHQKRRWALVTAVIALIFSLGAFTPLFQYFYNFFPGFKGLRGICKFDFLVSLFLALLAGIGLDYLIESKKKVRLLMFLVILVGFAFFGAELFILNSIKDGLDGDWAKWFCNLGWLKNAILPLDLVLKAQYAQESGLHAAFSLWAGGVTCALLAVFLTVQRFIPIFIYVIAGLAIIELFIFARVNRPTFALSQLQHQFDALRDFYSKNPGDYRVYGTGSASLVTGGNDIWEDEPMVLGRYGRFVCKSQNLSENQLFSVLPIFQKFPSILGITRLKYWVLTSENPIRISPFNFKALPRMQLVNHWEVIPDGQKILNAMFNPSFDPVKKVFLESVPDLVSAHEGVGGEVEWKDLSTDKIEIKARTTRPSLLLITDNYSAGWKAESLLGSAQSKYLVMPGDYFLRVIPLNAGMHHFILEYRPTAFEVGKWVSILFCILYFGVFLFCLRKNLLFKMKALP